MEPRIRPGVQLEYILPRRPNRRISNKIWRRKSSLPDDTRCGSHGVCISTGYCNGHVDQIRSGQFYKTRVVDRNDPVPFSNSANGGMDIMGR